MRLLRQLSLALLALALIVPAAPAAAQGKSIPLPGGATVKVKLPLAKGKGKAKAKGKSKQKRSKGKTSRVQVGIADEKSAMFDDPRFQDLGMNIARRSVAWDVFQYDWALAEVDEWLAKARAAGVRPLITFGRSRVHSRIHYIPKRSEYKASFKQFRQRYPWVTDFVATNESNYSDPGFKRPKLAAKYYLDMRKVCRTCRIAAATLLEVPGREKYMKKWVKKFKRAAKHSPKYWAVHNYVSANKFSLKGTRKMLKFTKSGQIWVTEVGGLVKRRSNFAGKVKMREGLSHAKKVTRFIFDRMMRVSPRISRVYLYHWNAATATDSWDSGLIGADGVARAALDIVASRLKKKR